MTRRDAAAGTTTTGRHPERRDTSHSTQSTLDTDSLLGGQDGQERGCKETAQPYLLSPPLDNG
ncbi:hypothetical protein E2C01_015338 [Portunus trituberculatus]|uniref:Uncharacterized protein n=1 Tax=Portunus trituberculatus TaxID=210409 RepID=A0A5B7DMG7_PORTR|nr:hypothetical protein [Portunus trituberculatus]